MKVLIACEESQTVCMAFRKKGHEAYSCDIQECSGGYLDWHIIQDVIPLINGNCQFETAAGTKHIIEGKWDLIIAHPPCTYLSNVGNRWFNESIYGEQAVFRKQHRDYAISFFMKFVYADCEKICIENPVGVMNTVYRAPDQIIQPYFFGDPFEKRTCLWLKGLSPLWYNDLVIPPERVKFKSGRTMARWYAEAWHMSPSQRSQIRSRTFPGIAYAMADMWG